MAPLKAGNLPTLHLYEIVTNSPAQSAPDNALDFSEQQQTRSKNKNPKETRENPQ
ncbi:MAG: hypothetical protein U5K56_04705 [Halioglobus sp.]|nr:hypothetical protein [Halioglobus sp.]